MVRFDKKIVQFGFGAVGKSFFEKISKEIKYDENKYYVISQNKNEILPFVKLGGLTENFLECEITKENFKEIFEKYLKEGDLLIDFSDAVGTRDICEWCAQKNIMYLNTGETDWAENWYSIFEENIKKNDLKEKYSKSREFNKYPIVLQHGNNPGLVSHFLKAGIEYISKTQLKKDKKLKEFIEENKFNEAARHIGLKMIHVNDIDLQKVKDEYNPDVLYSTWCIDSFFFEILSEATLDIGTNEKIDFEDECNMIDYERGFVEFKDLAINKTCFTYYPNGKFEGFLVPHEETITIAKSLEIEENGKFVYRPTVMFLYLPCEFAVRYMEDSKVNEYPNPDLEKTLDSNDPQNIIIRGHKYPKKAEIIYNEKISSGTEYVGVLLLGENFDPVWVGNRIKPSFLYKDKKKSYWQTPTITPVSMSALSAVCWMIKNQDKGRNLFSR